MARQTPRASHAPAVSPRPCHLAMNLAVAPPRVAVRIGARLWHGPLGAPVRLPSQALLTQVAARATHLEPVAIHLIERGVDAALATPLPEVLTDALVEHAVVERITAVLVEGETLEHVLEIDERGQVVQRVLAHPATHAMIKDLGESEQVAQLVTAIMGNDHVREAIREQTAGLVGEVAAEARGRSHRVDDALERGVRILLRRPPRPAPTVEVPEDGWP